MLGENWESDAAGGIMRIVLYGRYMCWWWCVCVWSVFVHTGWSSQCGASSSRECCRFSQPTERSFDRDRENVSSRRLHVREESHKMWGDQEVLCSQPLETYCKHNMVPTLKHKLSRDTAVDVYKRKPSIKKLTAKRKKKSNKVISYFECTSSAGFNFPKIHSILSRKQITHILIGIWNKCCILQNINSPIKTKQLQHLPVKRIQYVIFCF